MLPAYEKLFEKFLKDIRAVTAEPSVYAIALDEMGDRLTDEYDAVAGEEEDEEGEDDEEDLDEEDLDEDDELLEPEEEGR